MEPLKQAVTARSTAVPVVVTVDQWGDIVEQLAGDCGDVTTIIKGSSADPHDYEPTPADIAAFTDAKLVVDERPRLRPVGRQGDRHARRRKPAVVNGGEVGRARPRATTRTSGTARSYVYEVADAVTAELKTLAPDAAAILRRADAARGSDSMKPYDAEIAAIKPAHAGKTYGATEAVFDYMAGGCRARRTRRLRATRTPRPTSPIRRRATSNDVRARLSTGGTMDVLIYNTQTEGSIPEQIRGEAERASGARRRGDRDGPAGGRRASSRGRSTSSGSSRQALGVMTVGRADARRVVATAAARDGRVDLVRGHVLDPARRDRRRHRPERLGQDHAARDAPRPAPARGRAGSRCSASAPRRGNPRIGYVPQNYTARDR